MSEAPCKPLQFSLAALLGLVTMAIALLCGCGPRENKENKVEQILRGAQNVDRHAKEIQREAQSPAEQLSPE